MLLFRVAPICAEANKEAKKAHVDKGIADTVATFSAEQATRAEAEATLAKDEAEETMEAAGEAEEEK